MKRTRLLAVLMAMALYLFTVPSNAGQAKLQLVMFDQAFCEWCERWQEEIGVVYHKTREGRTAPLRKVNIHAKRPAEFKQLRGIRFTPTFVLTADGREVGRINGYPGEDFFWGLLGDLLKKANGASSG